ncbi:TIGR02678 family protein [Paenibacillus sp. J2TS4]|uniref:TIGR02678 family protein n=1 Tax=Paenibacillus sp. J2TS4 TaxID=2807194 RepID=UPI001B0DB47D|nr:TIGR02678 family protein [Paenibacillus sp. J2TS4]GIP33369.1 TIGR02678 family protein [Paenibacillus sp. J2TS4]
MSDNKGTVIRRIGRSGRGSDAAQVAERKKACIHALFNRPWILKEEDKELYFTVKDHYDELRNWFMEQTGYPLIVTRTLAKLDKVPVVAYPWMGFTEFREQRDYIFFTFGLWYLEGKTELDQFLLSDIVEEIREHMNGQGLEADWSNYYHRLSMARALKKLRSLGVLFSVDGDEGEWAQNESRNALFECSPNVRYILRRFPQDLTFYNGMEELSDPVIYADTPEGQALRRRHRVYRRLLLEPAVPDRLWNEEDLSYVLTQRRSIMDQLGRMMGWEGRRYREGLLFFHPELTGEATLFPTLSGGSDLALLVAGELRRQLNQEGSDRYVEDNGCIRVERSEMETLLLRLQRKHKEYWSKEFRVASSQELAELCFTHMVEWNLGVWEDHSYFLISPVLGRWNAEYLFTGDLD